MKMSGFWLVAPCRLVKFTDVSAVLAASIISVIALMTEAASPSEMSVNFYQTTWCNNPEDSHLQKAVCSTETLVSAYKSTQYYNPEDQY
jgi:hypothetical protein